MPPTSNQALDEARALRALKAFEKAGGTVGYNTYRVAHQITTTPVRRSPQPRAFTTSVGANASFVPVLVGGHIEVSTDDGHHGSAWLWGLGLGGLTTTGVITFNNWTELGTTKNVSIGGGGAVQASFWIEFKNSAGLAVGRYTSSQGVGGGIISISGGFGWS